MPIDLRSHLRSAYSRASWGTVLEDLFPSGSLHLLQFPEHIAAPCEHVLRTQQLGSVQLPDGNSIALLEVEVEDQVQLARNRVALRNFVAKFIDEAATQAVLAVFHQPGKGDWRLTYASKRSQLDEDMLEITSVQTAPRRYTFLLGENEPCRTAAGRLAEIRERDEHLTLEDVEKAFSVERLNKEFFKLYKEHYDRFVAHLLAPERVKAVRTAFGVPFIRDDDEESTAEAQDKADKPIRDFVKRLLGRLVFLHFLQKKGWMGCKAGSKAWTGGDTDFLHTYFQLAESQGEAEQFHSRWLLPLFFEALNKDHDERPGHLFAPTGTRIPYLNGGLFEASEVEQALLPATSTGARTLLSASSKTSNSGQECPRSLLDFPAAHFRALLEFFGQYHFTIDENDPEDHEVGIDPEMLGHIFENLLEDNKDKGAYYTPKAIVSYMARQSLLHYLQTHLGENAELITLLNEKDLTRLEKNGFVHQHAKRIAELLDAVKVCDPAIGSGAFPIGVLQEILWTRLALDWTLNTPEDRARLKRQIIQNSIHGVDLDPGAVEIARLRFWLALVVDEDQPRPLPNLDYKIHRADSLIEYIRGEPVHLGKVSADDKRTHGAITSLIAAKQSLFTAQRLPEKRVARFALYRALAEVAIAEFTWLRNEMGLIAGDSERAFQLDHGLKEFTHRLRLIDSAAKESAKIQDRILADLRAWFDDDKAPTFLWQLHFGEVFANGGFDIVIANPPYVRQEVIKPIKPLLKAAGFECYTGTADLFVYFYEKAVKLLKAGGALAFITSNKYFRAAYGKHLREFLAQKLAIETLIDFSDAPIFNNVIAYASILIGRRIPPPLSHAPSVYTWLPNDIPSRVDEIIGLRATKLVQSSLTPDGWRLESIGILGLLEKLRKSGCRLREYTGSRVYRGITTGLNEAFVVSRSKKDELEASDSKVRKILKPYLRGRDIQRWHTQTSEMFAIKIPSSENLPHPWSGHKANEAEAIFKRTYPSIYSFQEQYRHALIDRYDQGHYFWELRACTYWDDFEKPKIVSTKVSLKPTFALSRSGSILANTAYFIQAGDEGGFVVSLLNSSLFHIYSTKVFVEKQNGYFEIQPDGLENFPIPPASAADKARLSELAEACAAAAKRGDEETLAVHEAEIDQIVYRLFDLTAEEVSLIESSLAPTREKKPGKRSKAARKVPSVDDDDAEGPKALPPVKSKPAAAPTSKPFLPDELFSLEGELTPAKKAPAAREAASNAGRSARAPVAQPIPIDQTERNDVLATIREVFSSGGARDREAALKDLATALGYERLGPRIREVLDNVLRTAVRRGILDNEGGSLKLLCRSIEDYERSFQKELFLAAISKEGRVWHSRDDAIRLFTRHLGFRRTGSTLDQAARSLINGLLRDGSLEKDGQDWIRRT